MADGYLDLPGSSGNYADTPDHADFDITGDIDIQVELDLPDWTPGTISTLISKYMATGNQRSWVLDLLTNGTLRLQTWVTGSGTAVTNTSTTTPGFTDGTRHWVRATMDVDDGAGNRVCKFYKSDDGSSWTQVGSTVTTAVTTSIFSGSALPGLGARDAGTGQVLTGKLYRVKLYNGYDGAGTLKCSLDLTAFAGAGSTYTDPQSHVWTEHGTANFVASTGGASGTASISQTSTVSATATKAASGTASISSTPSVNTTATTARNQAASISQTSTVTESAKKGALSTGSISQSHTCTASGSEGALVTGQISQTSTVTATAAAARSATATVSSTPTVTATATTARNQPASISQGSTVTATATAARSGTASISQTSTVTATGTAPPAISGNASISQTSAVTASGIGPPRPFMAGGVAPLGADRPPPVRRQGRCLIRQRSRFTAQGETQRLGLVELLARSTITAYGRLAIADDLPPLTLEDRLRDLEDLLEIGAL